MKIAVIGAGMQGSACAFDLARSSGVEEIRLLDQDEGRLASARRLVEKGAAARSRPPKIESRRVNVEESAAVVAALDGIDSVVSAVPYFLNVSLARAAIRARASFCDMGGNTDVVREELSLHKEAETAGVSLIPDCGLAPGLCNVVIADALATLDTATEAHVRVGGLPVRPRPPLNYKLVFSAYGLINEYVGEATVLRDGRRTLVPALTEVETIDFPPPVGTCEAFITAGGSSTMPWSFEGRLRDLTYKTVRYPEHAEMIRAMAACGLFSVDPVRVAAENGSGNVQVRPRDVTAAALTRALDFPDEADLVVMRAVVKGSKGGRFATITYQLMDFMDERNGITAMMRTTAYPVSVVALMQAGGQIPRKGAMPPEVAIPPAPFLDALRERGIRIQREETLF
jgi:lysine 6-dehydrogenase